MIELLCRKESGQKEALYKSDSRIITIGRDRVNDIVLNDSRVSSHHAVIVENEKGDYFIRDIGSLHGIMVNGQRCQRRIIEKGDAISIIGSLLTIKQIINETGKSTGRLLDSSLLNDIEIPIADIDELQFSKDDFSEAGGQTLLDSLTFSANANKEFYAILAELLKLKEFKSFFAHFLNEICRRVFQAKCGYIALCDDQERLILSQKTGVSSSQLPPLSKSICHTVLKEGRPYFFEISKDSRVACAPLLDMQKVIGLIYIFDIPHDAFTETNKRLFSSIVYDSQFRKYINESRLITCSQSLPEDSSFFKWRDKFIGYKKTESMRTIYDKIEQLGKSDMHSILLGDKGTGKTYLAHMIHKMSARRKNKNFVVVDLNAIPATLVESELFGTVRGAFSNAIDRPGYFEFANGGTIFLDEIGDISLDVQSKLRAFIDTKAIRRIGSLDERKLDVRIIAATNKDLEALIQEGRFRGDLYDRLGGKFSTLKLVPLTERTSDIPLLANFFIDEMDETNIVEGISRSAIKALLTHDWQGNIRSLRDAVKLAIEIARPDNRTLLSLSDLPEYLTKSITKDTPAPVKSMKLQEVEKEHILKAMNECNWNKSMAAEMLGISRPTLNEKLKKYAIEKKTE
jgi:transcriptional regulator with PAS, ATPase and Fis domain/pSer/pThr/pTyr-binding forkhead associated (FHA) protein